ncbi:unnamed protein product [Effrenium voratum]|uniref:START domain-containing protein n=1 Tax=Effrenium voratum TaxID=2562239 RepID=A0AA36I4W4_9DINO|nr:unnamed protein product [Effrenium voratum]
MLGSHVAEALLERGYEVHGVVRPRSNLRNVASFQAQLHTAELTDPWRVLRLLDRLRPDVVFHFAAQAFNSLSFEQPAETLTTNLMSTLHLLEAVRQLGLSTRLVVAGSSTVYGASTEEWDGPVPEEAPMQPVSPYGVSKAATEMLALSYARAHNLHVVVVRFFIHLAPRGVESLALHDFARQVAMVERGLLPPVLRHGDLSTRRDITDIVDSAPVVVCLGEVAAKGTVVNLGSNVSYSMQHLLNELVRLSPSWGNQSDSPGLRLELDKSRLRAYDEKVVMADIRKVQKLTGWVPQPDMPLLLQMLLDYWRHEIEFRFPEKANDETTAELCVDLDPDSPQVQEVAVQCISCILCLNDNATLRWERLLCDKGFDMWVEFGLSHTASVTRLKLQAVVERSPRACFELLRDARKRPEFDAGCLEVSDVEPCGESAELVRMVYAAPGGDGSKKQEILVLRSHEADEEHQTFVVCTRSVRCSNRPPREGMQRGEVLPSGYIITAVADTDGKHSNITFLGQFSHFSMQPGQTSEMLEEPDLVEGGLLRQDNAQSSAGPAVLTGKSLPNWTTRMMLTDEYTSFVVRYDEKVSEVKAKAGIALGLVILNLIKDTGDNVLEYLTVREAGIKDQDILAAQAAEEVRIFTNSGAFAHLDDGRVLTWGDALGGGDSRCVQVALEGVVNIFSTDTAFAALKSNGRVVTWGSPEAGGDCSHVESQLQDVTQLVGNHHAFAALKSNGGVVVWGDGSSGGDPGAAREHLQTGVQRLCCSGGAFAALKTDGRVVCWGCPARGGETRYVYDQLQRDVSRITANEHAFAAVRRDGTLVCWGDPAKGGDCSAVLPRLKQGMLRAGRGFTPCLVNRRICPNSVAFAALLEDDSVIAWGAPSGGGSTREVKAQLRSKVIRLYATREAFSALKESGNVISWGKESDGGDILARPEDRGEVDRIYCTSHAFAALGRREGRVCCWGDQEYGGDCSAVASELVGVYHICGTSYAFAALRHDGRVVTWGHPDYGGEPGSCQPQLEQEVLRLFATRHAFAAVKRDGSIITWGGREKLREAAAPPSRSASRSRPDRERGEAWRMRT